MTDQRHFRNVLGHFCSGITAITSVDDGEPVGFACQSFAALSLDPPLVSFSPSRTSTTWPRIERTGRFCVNVLAEDQEELSRRFAVSGGDKFGDVRWHHSPLGSPILAGSLAWVDCEIETVVDAGDHLIVIGAVRDLSVHTAGGMPLLFFRGGYERIATVEAIADDIAHEAMADGAAPVDATRAEAG